MKTSIKSTIKNWLLVLAFALDEIAAAVIILVVLWFLDVEISVPIIIGIVVALGVVIFVTHKAVIPAFRRKKATGPESMVNTVCEVIDPLEPEGTVRLAGEYWKARSVEGHMVTGETVRVVRVSRLVLEVSRGEADMEEQD